MSEPQKIEAKVIDLILPIIEDEGLKLWDVYWVTETGRSVLRVFLEKEGGINLSDCSRMSHLIEDLIEVKNVIQVPYHLEVSSPGLEKTLRHKGQFETVIDKTVKIKTKDPIEGRRNFKGVLQNIVDEDLILLIDGDSFRVPVSSVQKGQLILF